MQPYRMSEWDGRFSPYMVFEMDAAHVERVIVITLGNIR